MGAEKSCFLVTSVKVTPSVPSSDPPCSSLVPSSSLCYPWYVFATSAHSGLQLSLCPACDLPSIWKFPWSGTMSSIICTCLVPERVYRAPLPLHFLHFWNPYILYMVMFVSENFSSLFSNLSLFFLESWARSAHLFFIFY